MAPISLALRRQQPATAALAPAPVRRGELAAQIGREVAQALSAAMERVEALQSTGRIDRAGLAALRQDIERARRIGMIGQQLDRLAGGQLQLAPEPLSLGVLMKEAVDQRKPEFAAAGLALAAHLRAAAVMGDPTLTFSLLQAVLDWALEHARGAVELNLALKTWPETAYITCRFRLCQEDDEHPTSPEALDTMSWRLLHQTADSLSLPLHRTFDDGRATLVVDFPRTLAGSASPTPPEAPGTQGGRAASRLAPGMHVLVLAPRREVRNALREALRPHALMIDFVTSVDEARSFCRGARPQALVYEAALGGESLERLRTELAGQPPAPVYVQISEDGKGFELRRHGAREVATVPRTAMVDALPVALRFELGRAQSYPV